MKNNKTCILLKGVNRMISQKANNKLFSLLAKLQLDKVEALAVIIAASNVLIVDITKKGELVIKRLTNIV